MKKCIVGFLFVVFAWQGTFAQKENKVITDPVLHRDVMVGMCTRQGLEQGIFAPWFNAQYKNYHPDPSKLEAIMPKINKTQITVVFGSWCGDSKMQVGRFFKILDASGYKKKVKIIAVTRRLKAGSVDITALNIRRIPTFVIYYRGEEVGRIVESPKTTLEGDLAAILDKMK